MTRNETRVTWYLKDPRDVWIYKVFSTFPSCRARKTTSNVVFPPGGTICNSNNNDDDDKRHQT